MNEKILPFGQYFSITLKIFIRKFFPLLGTLLLTVLAAIVIMFIVAVPVLIVMANNINIQMLQNTDILMNYLYSGQFANLIYSSLPVLAVTAFLCALLFMLLGGIMMAMIYLITDSYISGEKRSYGKMLAYSIKRAFPQLGTAILLSLLITAIVVVFVIIAAFIGAAMGVSFYNMVYGSDVIFQPGLIAYSIIMILLFIIMLCAIIYVSMIYCMAQLARIKYKLSGVATLRYSRLLTKKKRAKILGNYLLLTLIYMIIAFIFSFFSNLAYQYKIPFLPFILDLTVSLAGIIVSVFWAVIFINFDSAKGQDILKEKFIKAVCVKEMYFASAGKTNESMGKAEQKEEANAKAEATGIAVEEPDNKSAELKNEEPEGAAAEQNVDKANEKTYEAIQPAGEETAAAENNEKAEENLEQNEQETETEDKAE